MFKELGGLLPDALSRLKIRKPVEATKVCRTCDDILAHQWDHAVPMRAVTFVGGTVTVAVTSSAWAHEVTTRGEQLKEAVNKRLRGRTVNRIRTRVAPSQARGERPGDL